MFILDSNFLTKEEVDFWEEYITSREIPWSLVKNTVNYSNSELILDHPEHKDDIQFVHYLKEGKEVLSPLYEKIVDEIFKKFLKINNKKFNDILSAKINLTVSSPDKFFTAPHVDLAFDHKVFIYYFNDSDGQTVLFDHVLGKKVSSDSFNISNNISPLKGLGFCFDGNIFHAPIAPSEKRYRIVLNIDFV
jgi:hypothetical protein